MERYNRFDNTRRGPQIHAVPDSEKAADRTTGKKLPWGYETITTTAAIPLNDDKGKELPERGPFGRASGRRRGSSRSRSKTAEPVQMREEERVRAENARAEDRVFGSLRKGRPAANGERDALGDGDINVCPTSQQQPQPPQQQPQQQQQQDVTKVDADGEATEVLLYGFGDDLQWSAIDFYERVSGGVILEDYDRFPPGQRGYTEVARSYGRVAMQRTLSKAALAKKNRFAGGNHWIKVTFGSTSAAELACARSPHVVRGYLVAAEPWQGRGPAADKAMPATAQAGAMIADEAIPPSFSTATVGGSPNGSQTLTSQTEHETPPQQQNLQHNQAVPWGRTLRHGPQSSAVTSSAQPTSSQRQLTQRGTISATNTVTSTGIQSKLIGARRVQLLPAEQALMPRQPKQSWLKSWLWSSEVIGTTVPRKEDAPGQIDWEKASFYWKLWWWVDWWWGTDFCGLKGED